MRHSVERYRISLTSACFRPVSHETSPPAGSFLTSWRLPTGAAAAMQYALARIAPIAAVVIAAFGVALRLTGGSRVVAPVLFGLAALSLAAFSYLRARAAHPTQLRFKSIPTPRSAVKLGAPTGLPNPGERILGCVSPRARGRSRPWGGVARSVSVRPGRSLLGAGGGVCDRGCGPVGVESRAGDAGATTAGSGSPIDGTALAIPPAPQKRSRPRWRSSRAATVARG